MVWNVINLIEIKKEGLERFFLKVQKIFLVLLKLVIKSILIERDTCSI